MSGMPRDDAILAALRRLRPGAAFDFRSGEDLAGLTWLDQRAARPDDAAIEAEIVRQAQPFTATAERLDRHLDAAIHEFAEPPKQQPEEKPVMTPTSPGAHALTIKEVLDQHAKKLDQVLQAQMALLNAELDGQLGTVLKGTDAVISRVRSHTEDFQSILGQFSNEG